MEWGIYVMSLVSWWQHVAFYTNRIRVIQCWRICDGHILQRFHSQKVWPTVEVQKSYSALKTLRNCWLVFTPLPPTTTHNPPAATCSGWTTREEDVVLTDLSKSRLSWRHSTRDPLRSVSGARPWTTNLNPEEKKNCVLAAVISNALCNEITIIV